ncbi:hypothetical protein DFH08DRAFT_818965 [Mycena albidolilacea]|uniref:F-box domain-containing protein n=1 Tax=Mycena albidolilacea TaxID=1033008 RepID=A0AAD6ZFF8_9AGAR|nr:hypothetical protein DFH08DRAFT_818965 [Mycena albidolilacea]
MPLYVPLLGAEFENGALNLMQSTGALSTQTASLQAAESFESQPDAPNYPVLTLPPEIVSEIFVAFLPTYPDCPPTFGLHSPLLLCQICRHWRAIAIATPELWRAIQISVSRESGKAVAQLELLKTWLSRSGSCPLSINFSFQTYDEEILRTAVLHSERWECADLLVFSRHLSLIQVAMPLLRHLTLGLNLNPIPSEPITLFDHAPHLKQVVLATSFEKSLITLPWGQLTHLDAHMLDLEGCAEILCDATNLVHCSFRTQVKFGSILIPIIPIHHHLRHLFLRRGKHYVHSSVNLSKLFRNLTLPGLLTLGVYERGITLESLGEFITRSQCTLRELRVDRSSGRLSESIYREAFPSIATIVLEP